MLHNGDVKAGRLRDRFDAIILPDQRAKDMLNGLDYATIVPEYRGGLGDKGWQELRDFGNQGGSLIALGEACNLLVDKLPLPVKEIKRTLVQIQGKA